MPTAFAGDEIHLEMLINLDIYPLHDVQNRLRAELIEQCRAQLESDGCSIIKGLLTDYATRQMAEEAERLMPKIYKSSDRHNPYFTKPKDDANHPEGFLQTRTSGYINSDVIEPTSVLRQLYDSDVLVHFISECINIGPLYRWADTLARCPYGVMQQGDYFPWHFDSNDFTVTMLIQPSKEGGIFEYCKQVRQIGNENINQVMSILKGNKDGVKQLNLQKGDLQLFKGRYSMHRVTSVNSVSKRIVAIPSYVQDPYKVANPHHAECLYGRSLAIHHERDIQHLDRLIG